MTDTRIHVACLASYNNGRLHGTWIDVADQDADELRDEIAAKVLRTSPYPNVMVEHEGKQVPSAEEWAIHDHEGFADLLKEYSSMDDVVAIAAAMHADDDERRGFLYLVKDIGLSIEDAADKADEVRFYTSDAFDLVADYAQELADDIGAVPADAKWPLTCIDWAHAGRELVIGGDIAEFEVDGERFIVTNPGEF